jgi:deoxyhypusine synthase
LEGYLGYRGVRQQIGNLYHLEKRLFKDKYNQPWFDHGARTLKLSYMKKLKNMIVNNTSYQEAESYLSVLTEDLIKKYEKQEKSNKTEV